MPESALVSTYTVSTCTLHFSALQGHVLLGVNTTSVRLYSMHLYCDKPCVRPGDATLAADE